MKRSSEDILQSINPIKSVEKYNKTWQQFVEYGEINDESEPTEEKFLQYFDHLRNVKHLASSTLWSVYSMLNHKYQLLYGLKLQKYPRITMLLKSYEAGYQRKVASSFTKEEIKRYLETSPNTNEHLYMKAACVLCYFGGLRCADLASINTSDVEFNDVTGLWVSYKVSKQKGEQINNKFNIPIEYCDYLDRYDNKLHDCNASEGRLMKSYRIHKDGGGYFMKQPMGIHLLAKIPTKIAEFLRLKNAASYTGHAFRRTAATVLAESATSTSSMKKHFNWKQENTALKYVDNTNSSKLGISKSMRLSETSSKTEEKNETVTKSLNLENCQNIVINF